MRSVARFSALFAVLVVFAGLVGEVAAQSGCGCQSTPTYAAPAPAVNVAPTVTYYAPAPTVTYYAPSPAVVPATNYVPTTTYYAPTAVYYPPAYRPLFPYARWNVRRAYWGWTAPGVVPY